MKGRGSRFQKRETRHVRTHYLIVFKLILVISECFFFSPQGPNNIPADIVFVIRQKPHPHFVRQNDDLYYSAHISLEKVKKFSTSKNVLHVYK